MKISNVLWIAGVAVLAAVWGALFVVPAFKTPRVSVVLVVDTARAAPVAPVLADLEQAGYLLGEAGSDAAAWLDARASDGQPFFLVFDRSVPLDGLQAHLERTGLARRTIFAALKDGQLTLDRPGLRLQTLPVRDAADVAPTLLRLIGLTPSLPLPGRALAG